MPLESTISVDTQMSFEEYKAMLNRYAELPMPPSRSPTQYAAIAKQLYEKGAQQYRQQVYDDSYILFKRCLDMIESHVWKNRKQLDANPHSELTCSDIKQMMNECMECQERNLNHNLPQLLTEQLEEVERTREHRERILAAQRAEVAKAELRAASVRQMKDQLEKAAAVVTPAAPQQAPADAAEYEARRRELLNRTGPVSLFGGDGTAAPRPTPSDATQPPPPPPPPPTAPTPLQTMDDEARRRFTASRDVAGATALQFGLMEATVDHTQERHRTTTLTQRPPNEPATRPVVTVAAPPPPTTQPPTKTVAPAAQPQPQPQPQVLFVQQGPAPNFTQPATPVQPPAVTAQPPLPQQPQYPLQQPQQPGQQPGQQRGQQPVPYVPLQQPLQQQPQQPLSHQRPPPQQQPQYPAQPPLQPVQPQRPVVNQQPQQDTRPVVTAPTPVAPQPQTPAAPLQPLPQQTPQGQQPPQPQQSPQPPARQQQQRPAATSAALVPAAPAPSGAVIAARTSTWRMPAVPPNSFRRRRGLINLGNTCYINSTLQCLAATSIGNFFRTDEFIDWIADRYTGGGKIANTFMFVMRELYQPIPTPISASNLKRWIAKVNPTFDNSSQQDASEFMKTLIHGLHDDLNSKKHAKADRADIDNRTRSDALIARDYLMSFEKVNASPIMDLVAFQERSTVICRRCGAGSRSFAVTVGLELPIPALTRPISIEDCFTEYTAGATLSEYKCESCKQTCDASQQITLYSLPEVLIVTVKRFGVLGSSTFEKNDVEVAFQPELDLSPYVTGPSGTNAARCRYRLVGVVNHQGSLGGGHYTADARDANDGAWWYCSDEDVRPSVTPAFAKAYMLFYQRVSSNPSL